MPIYAYKCSACGHAADVLQKMSADPLSLCPACGASTYAKQVTAAGFALKGSGWYVTDFRGGQGAAAKPEEGAASKPAADPKSAPQTTDSTILATTPAPAAIPAAAAPASAPSTPAAT